MKYIVVIKGKPEGPYSLEQLKSLPIQPDSFLRKPGMDDYKEAHEFAEIRELMGFSFRQTAPQYFAGFDQRMLACAIDYFVILLGLTILDLFILLWLADPQQLLLIALISLICAIPIKLIYGSVAEASAQQCTIGKRMLVIKVGDEMGNELSLGQSLLRNFCKIISNFTLGFGYLYLFMNKRQQCLHDVIANTVVVKKRLL